MEKPKEISIEYQWNLYLQRCGLKSEDELGEDQRREMKRAFFGAAGQILIMNRDDVTKYCGEDDDKGAQALQDCFNEVVDFWNKESSKEN